MPINRPNVFLVQPHCSFLLRGPSVLNTQFDSIGLLALSAYLQAEGYGVRVFNFARALERGFEPNAMCELADMLEPIVFGISMNWLHLSRGALEIAELLKRRFPEIPVLVGGQHASLFAEEIVTTYHRIVDGVVVGEGEESLLEALEHIRAAEPLAGTPGLVTWSADGIAYEPRTISVDVDRLPLISYRDVFPPPSALESTRALAAIDTCRGGCTRHCSYCLESRDMGRLGRSQPDARSSGQVLAQIERFIGEGRDQITIQDQLFTHGDKPMLDLANGLTQLEAQGKHLRHLSIFVEPLAYSRQVFDALDELPVDDVAVSFGIETGSPLVARNLGRVADYDGIRDELRYVSTKRFAASTWWMLGLPGEGRAEVDETKQMVVDTMAMGIHPKWVTPLILFPQSPLAQQQTTFGIEPLFHDFEDFAQFSTTSRNEYGVYPELITHQSEIQSLEQTIDHVLDIKRTIEAHYPLLDERRFGKPDSAMFSRFRRATFF